MAVYKTMINERVEFVVKCDKCPYYTDSVESKLDFMSLNVICPRCKEKIDMTRKGELPENYREFI